MYMAQPTRTCPCRSQVRSPGQSHRRRSLDSRLPGGGRRNNQWTEISALQPSQVLNTPTGWRRCGATTLRVTVHTRSYTEYYSPHTALASHFVYSFNSNAEVHTGYHWRLLQWRWVCVAAWKRNAKQLNISPPLSTISIVRFRFYF